MISNPRFEFARKFIYLNGERIQFQGRPYLPPIFASRARNTILRCSRQTEKSTFLALSAVYLATVYPGISLLYASPRREQTSLWVTSRFMPLVEMSPIPRQSLLGNSRKRRPVFNMEFANGSRLFARSGFNSADGARGISADAILVDEFQDVAAGDLPVILETQSHSARPRIFLAGTPKTFDNDLESMFSQSTANEWTLTCGGCGTDMILDERCLGPTGVACPCCSTLVDVRTGRWVPRNPGATWGAGYWLNHLQTPWINYQEILERKRTYDVALFKNEVLGLPVTLGDHVVTRDELAACCRNRPMAQSIEDIPQEYRDSVIAGVDWGGGGVSRTAITVGFMRNDFVFEVRYFGRFRGDEDPNTVLRLVAEICHRFDVRIIGADGGGHGHVYNGILANPLRPPCALYGLLYSAASHDPHQEGLHWKWTINRSATIGDLFGRVKKQQIEFPCVEESGSFLDEFACETAEYDNERRTIKYTHPAKLPDDTMHATNYALVMAVRWWAIHGRQVYA